MEKKLKRILLLSIFCLIAFPVFATDYTQDANCQGAWLFEEGEGTTVADSSQNTHTGTFASAGHPAWSSDVPGAFAAGSVNFTPNDYINAENGWGDFATLSIMGWIKKKSNNTTEGYFGHGASDNVAETFMILSVNGAIYYRMGDVASGYVLAGSTISDTINWHHIAMTFDGTTVRGFFNGGPDGTDATGSYTSAVGWNHIGYSLYPSIIANAYETEIAFFDRDLDSTEINDIMDNGLTGAVSEQVANGSLFIMF